MFGISVFSPLFIQFGWQVRKIIICNEGSGSAVIDFNRFYSELEIADKINLNIDMKKY